MRSGVDEDVQKISRGIITMPLFNTKNITKSDLEELITNKVFENKELEYKDYSFANGKFPDKQRDKFMKEIAAFANTNGGIIIIGMQEDENRLPTNLSGVGMSVGDFDNWLSSFRQMVLSRIRPHLHGIECVPVELSNNNIAIVIFVPKSYARPHSFWDGNKDEFFMRYANGIMYMDIDDLRKAFLYTNGLQDKMRQFRRDRISLILANECIGDLGNGAKIVFHIIPEWSFELGNTIDVKALARDSSFRPLTGFAWDSRYNADGYCIYRSDDLTGAIQTYSQFFHNGIVEATEIYSISGSQDKVVHDWVMIQKAIIRVLMEYGEMLENFCIPKPWHISATMLNAKGYVTGNNRGNYSPPVERDIVNSLDGICTDEIPLSKALGPVFDSLSNAFGFSKSWCFEEK